MMDLTNYARVGWKSARDVCQELILQYEHDNRDMPPALRAYWGEWTAGSLMPLIKSPKKEQRFLQEIACAILIHDIRLQFQISPTSQDTSQHGELVSACRVLRVALKAEGIAIGLPALLKIWKKYGRLF